MNLIQLPLRSNRGATVEAATPEGWPSVIYLCGKTACTHFKGQRALLPGAELNHCDLVGYEPGHLCQAYYLEAAEELDQARRSVWDRLAEAERFEQAVAAAATATTEGAA